MSLPPRYRAAPDSLVAAVLLSFLATAGMFYVNIMPALVDGLKTGLGYSAREAGFVASANVYGAALGALTAVLTIKRLSWRRVALAALVILIAIDLVSTQFKTVQVLIPVRFLHGAVGGFLVGTAYGVFARTKAPDRVFGMLLVVQFGLGGLGLLVLPRLAPIYGAPVLFMALAAFSMVTLIMLPFLDDYPRPVSSLGSAGGRTLWAPLATALAAVFLFQCANMGLASYVIGLGRTFRLDTGSISGALGIANWLGALGSIAVVVIGVRFGRAGSIMAGMVLALAGTAVFLIRGAPWAYATANIVTSVAWSFTIAYLLGLCAAFDATGRSAALAGFCSKMGLASGPALGGLLLEETHYPRLVVLSCAGLALAAVAAAWPAIRLDRASAR